jgi:hypothetical protein
VKGRKAIKDDAAAGPAGKTIGPQRMQQQKSQEQQQQQHQGAPPDRPALEEQVPTAAAAHERVAEEAVAAFKGEYSDSSFIYEDNSGSESEQKQEVVGDVDAASRDRADHVVPSPRSCSADDGDVRGEVAFNAAVSACAAVFAFQV